MLPQGSCVEKEYVLPVSFPASIVAAKKNQQLIVRANAQRNAQAQMKRRELPDSGGERADGGKTN